MVSISQARGNDKFAESFTELELQHAMLLSKLSSTLKPSQLTDLGNLLKTTEALRVRGQEMLWFDSCVFDLWAS
jgi:hypothetical protein